MKNVRLTPLTPEDIQPYIHKESVVRLFIDKNWYAGRLHDFSVHNGNSEILLGPVIRFGHREKVDPEEPGDVLITENDKPICDSLTDQKQFPLTSANKINSENMPEGVLVVRASNGVAVLSCRGRDFMSVEILLQCRNWIP
jgi:hypothetical protein